MMYWSFLRLSLFIFNSPWRPKSAELMLGTGVTLFEFDNGVPSLSLVWHLGVLIFGIALSKMLGLFGVSFDLDDREFSLTEFWKWIPELSKLVSRLIIPVSFTVYLGVFLLSEFFISLLVLKAEKLPTIDFEGLDVVIGSSEREHSDEFSSFSSLILSGLSLETRFCIVIPRADNIGF